MSLSFTWGFFAHEHINRLAVFTLPPSMIGFYKMHVEYISEASVNPDKRRYAVKNEAPKHYIDLEEYGDSAIHKLPRYWQEAVDSIGLDALMERGTVPWEIVRQYFLLKDAFLLYDPSKILRVSAELGHYVADAHVPLHTTSNYDGQLTGQKGLHAFWESRLPELFFEEYNFLVGPATYQRDVSRCAWQAVASANAALDSVLQMERKLFAKRGEKKYSFETRGKQTVKVVEQNYAKEYHKLLDGMVERQMRLSVKMVGDLWYTAWVDAGQPDLRKLMEYTPSAEELAQREIELQRWKEESKNSRQDDHNNEH
ncbi:MAG: zinc dependent phospholipase C family protein [Cyclobacteriaceae bacterium]